MSYNIGDKLEVKIEKIVPNGLGMAFAEGLTVFVPLSAVGDKLVVEIRQIKGRSGFAKILKILEPSADRVEPPCEYFGFCGGCDFQQLSYKAQLDAKVAIIGDSLTRIGKIDLKEVIEIIPSPKEFGYRLRTQFHASPTQELLGFFQRQSHDIADIKSCAVLTDGMNTALGDLRAKFSGGELQGGMIHIEAAAAGREYSLYADELDEPTSELSLEVLGERYFFSARSFFQGNEFLLDQLIEAAVGDADGKKAVDLYCGAGLFSIPLAKRFESVTGVETSRVALQFAQKNCEAAGITNLEFFEGRLNEFFAGEKVGEVDFVLLDPPRSGVKAQTLEKIAELKAQRISYVSCNPSTLARDLAILITNGYQIDSIKAIDLFPQTHHVETIVRLSR